MAVRNTNFFTALDITFFSEIGGQPYDSSNINDRISSDRVKQELWGKTLYWHDMVLQKLPDFEGESIVRWNDVSRRKGSIFRSYTWTRIFKKGDKGKDIFFTVGIDGKAKALVYKLDYKYEGKDSINGLQQEVCEKMIKASPASWKQINIDNLSKYDWEKLVDETVAFIRQYEDLYDDTINEVWNTNQKRLARITYNEEGWQRPSGKYGKSKSEDSYEGKYGYGNEEWLFDKEKLIDDYHYASLEPILKHYNLYAGKAQKFDITLYTVDADTSRRYWVGEIKDLEVINEQDATRVWKYYAEKGWLASMQRDIKAAGGKVNNFRKENALEFFNVRFKASDAMLYDAPIEVPANNPLFKTNRYVLLNNEKQYNTVDFNADTFDFASANNSLPPERSSAPSKKQYERPPKVVEMKFLHREISDKLHQHFAEIYGQNKVKTNVRAGYGCNEVDMIIDRNDAEIKGYVYYEIKTYDSLRLSIREALGQILEYAMWPDKNHAAKFVIVTQPCPNEENKAKIYFENLRKILKIKIFYQSFDSTTGVLSEEM
jgi:hypothetical protein